MRARLPKADDLKWASFLLFLAAVYNVAWGAAAVFWPREMLALLGLPEELRVEFWQCIGMLVAVWGVGYWIASTDPIRYWPLVAVGLIGKVLGPLGAIHSVAAGSLPATFFWVNVFNDVVWWAPFAWILDMARRATGTPTPDSRPEASLYRRVLGARFDSLTPQLRRFHDATSPIEVRGRFSAGRGTSRVGNWLTDRAGFPRAADSIDVSLRVSPHPEGERWRRRFGDSVVESSQYMARGLLVERFGPLVMFLDATVSDGALEVTDVRSTFLGIPLPPFLTPRVHAHGIDEGDEIGVGVRIECSPLGPLVEYRGRVAVTSPSDPGS